MKHCPNHNLMNEHLKEIFYRYCNFVTKSVVDAAYGGPLIDKTFKKATTILDQVSKNNQVWYTKESNSIGFIFEMSTEYKRRKEV